MSLELAKPRLRVEFETAIYCNQEILNFTHYHGLQQIEGIHTNFACNKSQSINPHHIKIMHFKKMRDIELENVWNRVFIIVMLFETITLFGSFDELKMHQLC